MNTRLLSTLLLCILLISPVLGTELSATDSAGTRVHLSAPAERIVSLAPASTEILFALGLGDKVVGVTDYCNYPPEATTKEKVGSYSAVSPEKVITLKPDLVISSAKSGDKVAARLIELNIPVYISDPQSVQELCSAISGIANLAGVSAAGTAEADRIEGAFRSAKTETGSLSHPRTVHVIWNDPLYVSGNGTVQDEIITAAGGKNIFGEKNGYPAISLEEFVKADPEVIIVNKGSGMGGNESSIAEMFRTDPRYSQVSAVKNGRIVSVDSDLCDRAGPRITQALDQFKRAVHPELT